MNMSPLSRARAFASSLLSLRPRHADETPLPAGLPVPPDQVTTLCSPVAFRETLLKLIEGAQERILLAALYLQEDEAGREILEALHRAKAARPALDIAVFVDWHRAQRGLVGKAKSPGNAAFYQETAQRLGQGVRILGVPVQTRELLGVLHLKGFIVDDQVLYSGASLNNVYLQKGDRYRLDRYHLIRHRPLADCMAAFLTETLEGEPAVRNLCRPPLPRTTAMKGSIGVLRRALKRADYQFQPVQVPPGHVEITPLLGLGSRGNHLNEVILHLIQRTQEHLVVFTPYFNPPTHLRRAVSLLLKQGKRVTLVIGDKEANDFYIPPSEPFKTIGILPYLYEANLRRFCRSQQRSIDRGLLNVHLWKHGEHSYHLKGMLVDGHTMLLTGNNLNPRARRLDLENGLLIQDPEGHLASQNEAELQLLLDHAPRLASYTELQTVQDYPTPVQRLMKRLTRVRMDRLINQVL